MKVFNLQICDLFFIRELILVGSTEVCLTLTNELKYSGGVVVVVRVETGWGCFNSVWIQSSLDVKVHNATCKVQSVGSFININNVWITLYECTGR